MIELTTDKILNPKKMIYLTITRFCLEIFKTITSIKDFVDIVPHHANSTIKFIFDLINFTVVWTCVQTGSLFGPLKSTPKKWQTKLFTCVLISITWMKYPNLSKSKKVTCWVCLILIENGNYLTTYNHKGRLKL